MRALRLVFIELNGYRPSDCRHSRCGLSFVAFFSTLLCVGSTSAWGEPPPQGNLVYEIFVRSFADGQPDPHKVGDFRGIIDKLDSYLNDGKPETDHDLEVGILWLMPIHPAASYHGYDVTDYRAVHPDFGTIEDFKELLSAAHARGVRIIIDVPFNHTSDEHPWFKQAVADPNSPYRRYYCIEPSSPDRGGSWHRIPGTNGEQLQYLGVFSSRMPDLDFDVEAVRKEVKEIADFWLDLGVDGFRLDAAKHIYGTDIEHLSERDILRNNDWWREFSHHVYRKNARAILVGEVLGDPEMLRRHAWGLDALLDEPYMNGLRDQVAWPSPGFLQRHKSFVDEARALNRSAYSSSLPFPDVPFQSYVYAASHDRNPRLRSDLEERKRNGMPREVDQAYRLAMYLLLAMEPHAVLYSGDEIMQRGFKWNGNPPTHEKAPGDGSGIFDETLREPLPWTKSNNGAGQTAWITSRFDAPNDDISVEEQAREGGMLHLVRGITNLRTDHPAFADGELTAILSDTHDWIVFERGSTDRRYLVLINLTDIGNDYRFHSGWHPEWAGSQLVFRSDGTLRKWQNETTRKTQIDGSASVPPFGMVILSREVNGR